MFSSGNIALSKEAIATRMFRNAARNWGYSDTDINNFDPLVKLLIEACAVELYRIDSEMVNLQRNMTERLAELLIPEVYKEPRPTHAILHASSYDASIDITVESQFLYQKKVASVQNGPLDKIIDVFLSPAGRYKVINGDILYIAANNSVKNVQKRAEENNIQTQYGNRFPLNTVWLGIEVDTSEKIDLTNVSFFFDIKNFSNKQNLYRGLRFVKCYLNNEEIKMKAGLSRSNVMQQENNFASNFEELYLNERIEKEVSEIYNDQFLRFPDTEELSNVDLKLLSLYPEQFKSYIDARELDKFEKKLLWVKFEFPPDFDAQILEEIIISINCFPVINRQMNELNYRLSEYFNIVPLLSKDQFLSIHHVEGSANQEQKGYVFYPYESYIDGKKGTYTVRGNNLQRFDERNANELLEYLVEILRDESRAFTAFGQDFLNNTIKVLNQNIETIAKKLNQNTSQLNSSPSYLLINPIADGDVVTIQYWTSIGEIANGIRVGSEVILYEGSNFKKERLVLMTQTSGGKDKLKKHEVLRSFKSVLLSRNRIVTPMDIKYFCLSYLQDKAEDVEVEKGMAMSSEPNKGIIPVVDVKIKMRNQQVAIDAQEIEQTKRELVKLLEEKSAVDLVYNVILN